MSETPTQKVQARRIPVRRPRSLLVEDQIRQLDLRRELLRLREVDVIPASSGREAIGRLQAMDFDIDVLVTDLNLGEQGDELDGVDIAETVDAHSGGAIPTFAYSGKVASLPVQQRRLFNDVVLKSASIDESRQLLDEAAKAASNHFETKVQRAVQLVASLEGTPRRLAEQDLRALRSVIAGSSTDRPSLRPEAVGVLSLAKTVQVPYVLYSRHFDDRTRHYAAALGHEYLYGFGSTPDDAVKVLEDLIVGYAKLVEQDRHPAVGESRRLRDFLLSLSIAAEAV